MADLAHLCSCAYVVTDDVTDDDGRPTIVDLDDVEPVAADLHLVLAGLVDRRHVEPVDLGEMPRKQP